jgi:hypothetical protein
MYMALGDVASSMRGEEVKEIRRLQTAAALYRSAIFSQKKFVLDD